MAVEDPEEFLRAMVAPLRFAQRDQPLPGVPFSREAVANAFVMLGLLPEALAEEILAQYRPLLTAEGFHIGVLIGELSVRPGAHGYHDAGKAGPYPAAAAPESAGVATGPADPPWPTPAECYLEELAQVTSMWIATGDRGVELDTEEITAAVASALLSVGALPSDSALLTGSGAAVGNGLTGWRRSLAQRWVGSAHQRARIGVPHRADLAVRLPLQRATAVIESVTAHDDMVSIQLYGHPWVSGEYWPMITPCFQVRAIADTGAEHAGMSGSGSPRSGFEFTFWPPVAPAVRRLRVIVSTLWEAAWAEIDIPGRPS